MEAQSQQQHHQNLKTTNRNMKKSWSLNSDDAFHSPLRSDAGDPAGSPPFESPQFTPEKQADNSRALVAVNKSTQYSPFRSQKQPESAKAPSPGVAYNRREEVAPSVSKVGPFGLVRGVEEGVNGVGGDERSGSAVDSIVERSNREGMLKTAALVFRVSELVLCLISFSVMAADKTQGWSGDSFDRYKEYRYCLAVNVMGFGYAAFQAYNLSYYIATRKYAIRHHLRRHFEFFMDQVLAYLLISASSSAATRVDDWQSNWGKDEFTEMATASVSMAFLAFVAFALSSLISGYDLCTHDSA